MRTRSTAVAMAFGQAFVKVISVLVLGWLGVQVHAADAQPATYKLDIPAQNLNDALQSLALASQYKLLYSSELVDGKNSRALNRRLCLSPCCVPVRASV